MRAASQWRHQTTRARARRVIETIPRSASLEMEAARVGAREQTASARNRRRAQVWELLDSAVLLSQSDDQ